jgi:hypothetical protein
VLLEPGLALLATQRMLRNDTSNRYAILMIFIFWGTSCMSVRYINPTPSHVCKCFNTCDDKQVMEFVQSIPFNISTVSSPWYAYIRTVYSEKPRLPYDLSVLRFFYYSISGVPLLDCNIEADYCAAEECNQWKRKDLLGPPICNEFRQGPHLWFQPAGILFACVQDNFNLPPETYVEVMRYPSLQEQEGRGTWFYLAPGSGIFYNTGKVLQIRRTPPKGWVLAGPQPWCSSEHPQFVSSEISPYFECQYVQQAAEHTSTAALIVAELLRACGIDSTFILNATRTMSRKEISQELRNSLNTTQCEAALLSDEPSASVLLPAFRVRLQLGSAFNFAVEAARVYGIQPFTQLSLLQTFAEYLHKHNISCEFPCPSIMQKLRAAVIKYWIDSEGVDEILVQLMAADLGYDTIDYLSYWPELAATSRDMRAPRCEGFDLTKKALVCGERNHSACPPPAIELFTGIARPLSCTCNDALPYLNCDLGKFSHFT